MDAAAAADDTAKSGCENPKTKRLMDARTAEKHRARTGAAAALDAVDGDELDRLAISSALVIWPMAAADAGAFDAATGNSDGARVTSSGLRMVCSSCVRCVCAGTVDVAG
jgi:hypothetical protein